MSHKSANGKARLQAAFPPLRSALIKAITPMLGNIHLAEDIVHEAFVKISEHDSLTNIQQPEKYLHRLVRNLALDKLRRLKLEKQHHTDEDYGLNEPSTEPSPEKIASDISELRVIEAALNSLPERTRQVFKMHRLQGVPQKKIAEELGVSPTLINFMIRDALTQCRNYLLKASDVTKSKPPYKS